MSVVKAVWNDDAVLRQIIRGKILLKLRERNDAL